jgi:hypothetical protein
MSQQSTYAIAVIGIDIGKNWFHVLGHDRRGAIVLRQKWSAWPSRGTTCQPAVVTDRDGGLRRRGIISVASYRNSASLPG